MTEEILDMEMVQEEDGIEFYVVEVDRNLFALLQSFVDSSTKLSYPWNKPFMVSIHENKPCAARFKKSGRWVVDVYVTDGLVVLMRERKPIWVVEIKIGLEQSEIRIGDKVYGDNVEFIPAGGAPYGMPVSARAIIEKAIFYLNLTESIRIKKISH